MKSVKEYVLFFYNVNTKPNLKRILTLKSSNSDNIFSLLSAVNRVLSRIVVQIEFLYPDEDGELKNISHEAKINPITMWEYKEDMKSYIGIGEMSVGEPFNLIVFIREK